MHLKMEFNFEGKALGPICFLNDNQMIEIADRLTSVTLEIVDNYKEYTFDGTGAHEGDLGLHRGKILERYLKLAINDQERALILLTFNLHVGRISKEISKKVLSTDINDLIKNILQK